MAKQRLDILLVEKGLAGSRERAKRMIMAGEVLVDNQKVDKAGATVKAEAEIRLLTTAENPPRTEAAQAAEAQAFPPQNSRKAQLSAQLKKIYNRCQFIPASTFSVMSRV